MLLLGVIQAQASGAVAAGSFDLLETQVLSSSAASVTFSGLSAYAADYQHLQIRAVARTNRAANGDTGNLAINGITTSSYGRHYLQGNGSTVSSDAILSQPNSNNLYALVGNNATANTFTGIVIDILDPFENTKSTTYRALSGQAANENLIRLGSGSRYTAESVTSITLSAIGSFVQYSRFSLYGVKGSA